MLQICLFVALLSVAFTNRASAEERCAAIVGDALEPTYEWLPDYTVSTQSRPLSRPNVSREFRAIVCVRESLYLLPSDADVLTDLGVPFVASTFAEDNRMLMLRGGRDDMAVTVFGGRLTQEERAGLERIAAEMRIRLDTQDD